MGYSTPAKINRDAFASVAANALASTGRTATPEHVRACCGVAMDAAHLESCEFHRPPKQCPAVTHVWCHAPWECPDPCAAGFSNPADAEGGESASAD